MFEMFYRTNSRIPKWVVRWWNDDPSQVFGDWHLYWSILWQQHQYKQQAPNNIKMPAVNDLKILEETVCSEELLFSHQTPSQRRHTHTQRNVFKMYDLLLGFEGWMRTSCWPTLLLFLYILIVYSEREKEGARERETLFSKYWMKRHPIRNVPTTIKQRLL